MKLQRSSFVFAVIGFLIAAAGLFFSAHSSRGQNLSPAALHKAADQHYNEKSYALALPEYQNLLTTIPPKAPGRVEIEYRIAVSLGQAQKWDEALAAWGVFLAAHTEEPLWVGRGQYQLGLLLAQVPHQGYKVGTRLYRGNDYPHTQSSEKPEYVYLQQDDAQGTLNAFEAAVKAYEKVTTLAPLPGEQVTFNVSGVHPGGEASSGPVYLKIKDPEDKFIAGTPPVRPSPQEVTDLYFDLAKILPNMQPWGSEEDWKAAKTTDWTINPALPYDVKWPQPKKVLYLLDRIPRVNPTDTHALLLDGLAKGLYVAAWHNAWAHREWIVPPGKPGVWKITQTLPYFPWDPIVILNKAADQAPNDEQTPQLRLIVAQWTNQAGDYAGALKLYQALTARYPASKWAEDARAAAQEIQRKSVSVSVPGPQPTGQKVTIELSTRNLKSVILRAYKVPLETALTTSAKLNNPENHFTDFTGNFGDLKAARLLGTKVAEWNYATGDQGDYQLHSESLPAPLTATGAYLIVADGDDGQVRGAAIVVITDLAVMKKTDKDNVLCFVADARSGKPVPGATVIVRQHWSDGTDHVQVSQGVTDADGLLDAPTVKNKQNLQIETFAYAPGSRYALTGANGWWDYGSGNDQDLIKIYGYTDRPVYRPQQTVYFRELIAKRAGGGSDFAPMVGVPVHVWVTSPKGDQLTDQTLTSSPFGSVAGTFTLPNGAALGEYTVNVQVPIASGTTTSDNRFRVEEYKRPEYLVKVTPAATQSRFGDKITATINATYYSGPPVAGAKVSYKVFRSPYYPSYRFPQPYDWYYRPDNGDYANEYADQGELVTKGDGVTDAQGNLPVVFQADKGTRGYGGDYAYTVMADVVDSSRRQISGEGILHVTNQAFYAYLNIPNGFYQRGDKVQVELRTQDADQQPVSTTGTLTVSRITYDGGKRVVTPVHTQELTTDADGKAFTTWQSAVSGEYQIEFSAKDKFQQDVVASAPVWVEGDDLNNRTFHVGGITILTDKTTYEQGETAHLLLVSDQPDNWVLLTSESGNQILTRQMVHVAGRARTIDVPITRADIPNFAFGAIAVRDFQFFRWQQEVFVPPTRQFVHMAVTGDKPEYKPGDTGTFHVTTTDYLGRPIAAEVSLAVVDTSVFYIQKEYAPDIRLFYYGDRRNINVQADSSDSGQMANTNESDFPQQTFKPHGIVLPDMGRLLDNDNYNYRYYNPYNAPFRYDRDSHRIIMDAGQMEFGGFGGSRSGTFFSGGINSSPVSLAAAPMLGGLFRSREDDAVRAKTADVGRIYALQSDNSLVVDGKGQTRFAPTQVRRNFAETAFWTPAVVTNKTSGAATLTVKFPDTLTTWKATARGLTAGMQVGSGDTQVVTNKHLLVRLEAPRFFVERDRVTLSAIVRNDLATEKQVRVTLDTNAEVLEIVPSEPTPARASPPLPETGGEAGGQSKGDPNLPGLMGAENLASPSSLSSRFGRSTRAAGEVGYLTVPAHSEKRVDWVASVVGDGQARVKMTAETDEESDAVEQTFPALVYGVQKFVATSGVLQNNQNSATLTVNIPQEHKPGSAALLVQVNPSLAATALDALPYLADYPYGCVEQTMSRFLPSVLVAKTLRDAGVNLDTLHQRALKLQAQEAAGTPFGQKAASSPATDQSGYTYPSGTPGVMKTPVLAEDLPHGDRWNNPVFDPQRLQSMVDEGLSRLESMQQGDGGWGWWGGSSQSDPYMSAYVVYGLATAKQAGVAVPEEALNRGFGFLAADVKNRDDEPDLGVWETFALSFKPGGIPSAARHIVDINYEKRDKLSAYGLSLLALTLHNLGENDRAASVCRNLQNTATIDRENGTASWKLRYGWWWDWYNNDVETDAWALKAYVAILPQSDMAPMVVKWLTQNQHGTAWHSTKETAMAVSALTDYIRLNNELAPDYTVTVALGDKISRKFIVNRDNALLFDNQFLVPDTFLPGGVQTVTITKQGGGRLYYSSALQYFTTEEKIAGVGTELKIQRRYYKLTPKIKEAADYAGGKFNILDYTRAELPDGASLQSGDMIEVELILDSKNEYDYCCFEDMKPAGCEPIDLRSGERYGDGLCSDMELRDTKTAFFVDHLPQGTRVLRYRLRAEVPGAFHALPTNGYAMYAPDVRALSESWHVTIMDKDEKAGGN